MRVRSQSHSMMTNFMEAVLCQTRSIQDCEALILWEAFVRAACRIQRAYRKRRLFSHQTRAEKCRHIQVEVRSIDQQASMENIINGCATKDERLDLWRSVIEIRRIRPLYTADVCLRVLIECKGDLHHALAVTANSTLSWKNSNCLSVESRENMLICVHDYQGTPPIKEVGGSPLRSGLHHFREYDSELDNPLIVSKKVPLFDVSSAMAKIYFSK